MKFEFFPPLFRSAVAAAIIAFAPPSPISCSEGLRAGAAAISITPFGKNSDWSGPVTASGVWGEVFTDQNGNGRWDEGEPFQDDPRNTELDPDSRGKYDGIYLAGFGRNRPATGMHDDLWARAIVVESGGAKIALVSIDLVGYYSDAGYYGVEHARRRVSPTRGIQEILVSSTHNHEGPDSIGLWGSNPLQDGKFPLYLQFVDRQIAACVEKADSALEPARLRLGSTRPARSPSLRALQTRTHRRPPNFFDDELRVMRFASPADRTIATLVNWNTHPESMDRANTLITSDFPHAVRERIERELGGIAVYVSGDLGAAEIVGRVGNGKQRKTFDGVQFSLRDAGDFTFARMEAIGRDVGKAALEADRKGKWSKETGLRVLKSDLEVPVDNAGYLALLKKGVLEPKIVRHGGTGPVVPTSVFVITLGDAEFVTAPGELFPEVFFGVEKHRRRDCPAAETGRPMEPSVRNRMKRPFKFVMGLCPDQLGYIVPGYDFHAPRVDTKTGELHRAPDPCSSSGVPAHYHETQSASSSLAALWTCAAATLLDGKTPDLPACRR